MDNGTLQYGKDGPWNTDANLQQRIESLRLLVCELLRTNEQLRDALQVAKPDAGIGRHPNKE